MYACIFAVVIITIAINEYIQDMWRQSDRKTNYLLALKQSKLTEKPLIIIGDTHNWKESRYHGPQYSQGDMTIDLLGCVKKICNTIESNAYEVLSKLKPNSAVIYISCTLEYIKDLKRTFKEIRRVSGDDYYITYVKPYTLTAYFYSFSKENNKSCNVILQTKPKLKYIDLSEYKIKYA